MKTYLPKPDANSKKWYLVNAEDREYVTGITPARFQEIGATRAKEEYLSAVLAPRMTA